MKILVVTLGSIGDVLPFIAVGTALRARGHEIVIASNAGYEGLIKTAGFEFCAIWHRTSQQTLDDVLESNPEEAWSRVQREMFAAATGPAFDFVERNAQNGPCIILASWSAFGARLAHERLGVPLCSAYLSPHALAADDRPPAGREFRMGFFPEWFCPLQSGCLADARLTGFPMFEDASVPALPKDLERFLENGEPPVVITPGSFARRAEKFFRESLAACAALNRRAVLLTPHAEQLPAALSPAAIHFKYVSLQRLLGRSAALICHGGIGTCAQAMKAGIPQLVAPVFFDQFDNASRIEALGIGRTLAASRYNQGDAAEKLDDLLKSVTIKQNCSRISENFHLADPVREICQIVEAAR